MAKRDVKTITNNLNRNVDVLEATFEKYNCQVISYGFCGINTSNGWMEFLVELATIDGTHLTDDIHIKVNLYDEQNIIIYSYDVEIDQEDFSGYDTLHFYLNEDNLAFDATRARLFAVKS